ncbi:MAG TPA: hypothetical protein VK203_25935 [Nostocaceae cyanobacterium]|nr:hypothetical protein [Nostocaceae cyanobacterium]
MQLMAERLESLKAGIIGGFSLVTACLITSFLNALVVKKYLPTLFNEEFTQISLHFWLTLATAGFSGLLFGVTYRYIIRADQNSHLKTGAVFAFGLVRGLSQIETGWNSTSSVLPFCLLAGESVFWFAGAAVILDTAISRGWVKPFCSFSSEVGEAVDKG